MGAEDRARVAPTTAAESHEAPAQAAPASLRVAAAMGNHAFGQLVARAPGSAPMAGTGLHPDAQAALGAKPPGGPLLLRDDKDKAKYTGPAPETPFELTDQEKVEIEKLAVDKLRDFTNGTVGQAYTNFTAACLEAKAKLERQEKSEAEAQEKMLEFVFGAVGMLLGPVGKAVGAKLAGPAMQQGLQEAVRKSLPGLQLPGGIVKGMPIPPRRIPSGLETAIASETVTALAAKLSAEQATSLVESAAGKVKSAAQKIQIGGSPHKTAVNFVHKMQDAADGSATSLRATVSASDDPGALMGVQARFEHATPSVYRAEVDTKVQHFLEQVARTLAGQRGVAEIDAYGQKRLCTYTSTSDHLWKGISYRFESWVTPDMEPIVRATNPNPRQMDPSDFENRVPEPSAEAAQGVRGSESIVRMNAYGRPRLAVVKAATGVFDTTGTFDFIRWVPADEEAEHIARGQAQMHGIPNLDPGKIDGHLPAPAE